MPGMDGWAVLTTLKADSEIADIPVIMLTMVDDKNLGFALGATDFMTKPVNRDRLLTILNRYRIDTPDQTVLIVEDDVVVRQMLKQMLEKEGWQVREAENGRVGRERLAENPVSLILLDLMMPEMDGFEFVNVLRQNPAWKAIPVVVVTAKDITLEDRMRLNRYAEKIIQKGAYSKDELLGQIRILVSQCVKQEELLRV